MTSLETRPRLDTAPPRPAAFEPAIPTVEPYRSDTVDVAIVGLGYVGLPTALSYLHAGSRVLGLEISAARIDAIRAGRVDLLPSDHSRLAAYVGTPAFEMSSDPASISRAGAVVICVPTPIDDHLVPDLTILRAACEDVVANAIRGQIIILTSTTYVGCTQDLLVEPLAERGLKAGEDISVVFSPERIDPGNVSFDHEEVPRVVGGATVSCALRAATVLGRTTKNVHHVDSLAAAEMTKLLENTFRAVNIALANEVADICRELDVPVTDVIDAAATKPYGFMPFLPGPGVGGHCIPCDPHYLLWQLRERRVAAPMISQAMTEIASRPARVVERAAQVLSDVGLGLAGTRILVLGVTYKPNVDDVRESPALEILHGLERRHSVVAYIDPHVPELRLPDGRTLRSIDDPEAFDPQLVILHTRHRDLDLSWLDSRHVLLDGSYRELDAPRRFAL